VKQDEEAFKQGCACQRSGVLDGAETAGEAESWYRMPQMKRLKKLTLLVSNDAEAAR
jgi:hypothetical protein